MTPYVLALILLAAILHATWNTLLKTVKHTQVMCWLQMVVVMLCLFSYVVTHYPMWPAPAWISLIASGIMQAVYYLLLAHCYEQSEQINVVYPLMRGSAPVFVCIVSLILGIDHLTAPVVVALGIVIFGIYIVNMPHLNRKSLIAPFIMLAKEPVTRLAIVCGAVIAAYTLCDKVSLQYTDSMVIYLVIDSVSALLLAPMMLRKPQEIKETLSGTGKIKLIVIALFTFLAYYLALVAMSMSNASYVSSIREVSVVFVSLYALISALLKKEKVNFKDYIPKLAGSLIIFCGIMGIALWA